MGLTSVANGVFVVRFVVPLELELLPPLLEPVVVGTDARDGEPVTVTCWAGRLALLTVLPVVSEASETDETDDTWFGC